MQPPAPGSGQLAAPHDLVRLAGRQPRGARGEGLLSERPEPDREDPAAGRIRHQSRWVEWQIQQAIERGEFDDVAGKPLPDLGTGDPDWWVRKLIEREQITGVLPEALQLRKDDAGLNAELDRMPREHEVREALESFNRRVVNARRQLMGGPPVVTPLRDVEAEVRAWRERRR